MIYYMSATGSDSNDGLTEATPWKTITALNVKFAGGTIGKGTTVLFKAGDILYGKIRPPTSMSGTTPGFLTFGAYGPGAGHRRRPEISSYKLLNTSAGWTLHAANVWKVDLADAQAGITHTGYDGAQGGGGNIGFLRVEGAIKGAKKWALGDLTAQWDFYCESNVLYVRSTANPTTLAADIRAATDGECVRARSAVQVVGLKLCGSGGHGVAANGVTGMRVYDCEICEIGGSQLSGTTRYGNGVENYGINTDVVVENNEFHDIYDVAYTAQGPPPATWTNITVRGNLAYRCGQFIEFWADGVNVPAQGFKNFLVEDNVSLFMGYSWGAPVRADQNKGVHILIYAWTQPADVIIRRNVFYDADTAYRYNAAGYTKYGITYTDNMVFLRPGKPLLYQQASTIEQWATWTVAEGVDQDSQFFIIPPTTPTTVDGALQHISSAGGLATGWIRALGRGLGYARGTAELLRAITIETPTEVHIPAVIGVESIDFPTRSYVGSFTPVVMFSATVSQALSFATRTPVGWQAFDVWVRVADPGGGSGNVVWGCLVGRRGLGDSVQSYDYDGGLTTHTVGEQYVLQEFRVGTAISANSAKETIVRVGRVGSNVGDTLPNEHALVSVILRRA